MTKDTTTLLKAAINASNTIHGIYQWVDMIEAEGGAGTISGVAKCHAFLTSMKKNRSRLDSLVMSPLAEELKKTQEEKQSD
jgi:tRNA G37 N-methylase TrmD